MAQEHMIQLGDILTNEQADKVAEILNCDGDDFKKCNALKRYFESIKSDLDKHEVGPGYLAYVVVYKIYGGQNGHTNIPKPSDN